MAWYSLRVLGSVSTHTQQKCGWVQNYAPICGFLLAVHISHYMHDMFRQWKSTLLALV